MTVTVSTAERVISRHFEVVDDQDRTVGSAKYANRNHALDLRDALAGINGHGPLAVAEITEHMTIRREVVR
jgi:hypothetical protein